MSYDKRLRKYKINTSTHRTFFFSWTVRWHETKEFRASIIFYTAFLNCVSLVIIQMSFTMSHSTRTCVVGYAVIWTDKKMNTGGLTNELIIPTFEDIISLRDFYYVKIRRLTHDQWVFQEVGLLDELKHFIGIITYFIFKFFQKVTFSRCLNLVIKLFISEKFPYHHIYIIIHAIVSFTHTVYISI